MEGSHIISVGSRFQALITLGYKEYAYVLMRSCIRIYLSGLLFRVWVHGTIRCFGREIFTRLCLIL